MLYRLDRYIVKRGQKQVYQGIIHTERFTILSNATMLILVLFKYRKEQNKRCDIA
jgi:hypothetical protein